MTILMDRPNLWDAHAGASANLISDLEGEEGRRELLGFAQRMGLDEVRLRRLGRSAEHLDIFGNEITLARRAGAQEVSLRELVQVLRRKRGGEVAPAAHPTRRAGGSFHLGLPIRMMERLGLSA